MAWIESHQTLREHPKLFLLMESLDISQSEAIGLLHLLWWWAMDYAPDGVIEKFPPKQIARACDWRNAPSKLLASLVSSGFAEKSPLRIHDWREYRLHYDLLMEKKARTLAHVRRRVKRWRDRNAKKERYVTQCNAPTVKTVPDLTLPKRTSEVAALTFDFQKVYDLYPNKDSRKDAERHFRASVKTEQDYADIQKALANYIKNLQSELWKQPKSAKTWFNDWRSWVAYSGASVKSPAPIIHPRPIDKEQNLTRDDLKQMHDKRVEALGRNCKPGCEFCKEDSEPADQKVAVHLNA